METEKIVMEFYSLRAGLSLIAQETDKYEKELEATEKRKTSELFQAQITKVQATSEDAESTVVYRKAEQAVESARMLYLNSCKKLDEATRAAQAHEFWVQQYAPIRKRRLALGILFVLLHLVFAGLSYFNLYWLNFNGYIFIPVAVISLAIGIKATIWAFDCYDYYDYHFHEGWSSSAIMFVRLFFVIVYAFNVVSYLFFMAIGLDGGEVNTAIVAIIAISAGLCTIATTILIFENYKYYSPKPIISTQNECSENECTEKEKEKYMSVYSSLKSAFEQQKTEYKTAIRKAEQEYEAKCKKIDARYQKDCVASANSYTAICTPIWNTLIEKYNTLLDVRDWKILDLVIWQLETHRAETVKEALQLADREVQTDRIVGALKSACKAISSQIRMGFGNLQSQLDYNFNALANRFATASNNIASKLDGSMQIMQANQTVINRRFEQIFSQSSLQTALLEKADTSSSKLLEAVNKLRETKFKIEEN